MSRPTAPRAGAARRASAPFAALATLAVVAWLALRPGTGPAQELVIYRCVGADGAVTLQNGRRCPAGTREQRRVVEAPRSSAPPAADHVPALAPVAVPAPVAPAAAPDPAAPPADAAPAPAPPVYACRSWDGARYFGDSAEPAPRCAPLRTTGLDGRAPSAAQACEMRLDTCEPVAEAARCEAWAERARRAEAALAFPAGDVDAARAERDRVRAAIAGTVCAR